MVTNYLIKRLNVWIGPITFKAKEKSFIILPAHSRHDSIYITDISANV